MIRLLSGVTALLLASGCATLGGTRQYVSVDSEPRGLEVVDQAQGTVLGRTPFFLPLKRQRAHSFELRAGPSSTTAQIACEYRWKGSLVANAPAALLGIQPVCMLPAWGAAAGVDLATGAAWSCPDALHFSTSMEAASHKTCPIYAVSLPRHEDIEIARLVAQTWASRRATSDACSTVVALDEVEVLLERFGIDHVTGLDVTQVDRSWLNELGHRTGATHLVVFPLPTDRQRLTVTPGIYDLHSLKLQVDKVMEVDTSTVTSRHPAWRWIVRHVRLLPNAVSFSPSLKSFEFIGRGDTDAAISDARAASVLPSILGNWSVGFVEHPARHGTWGVSGGFGPGAYLGYNSRVLGLPRGGESHRADVTAVHLIGLYSGSVSLHTPLGAITGALGVGAGGALHWDGDLYQGLGVRGYAYAELAWTAFVTDQLFVRVTGTYFQPSSPELMTPDYELASWQQMSITFGWHLAGLRSRIRGLLSG